MLKESAKVKGSIRITLSGPNIKTEVRESSNMFMDVGRAATAALIATGVGHVTHAGLGTGALVEAATQTDLITAAGARVATTNSVISSAVANDTAKMVAVFGPGVATGAIVESAVFNALTLGTMFARKTFAVLNKGAADTITVEWMLQVL